MNSQPFAFEALHPVFKLSTYFFIGSVFYLYQDKIVLNKLVLLLLLLLTGIFIYFQHFYLIAPFVVAYCLFMAIDLIPINNFDRFGDFSYGLYLYAFPTTQTLVFFGLGKLGLLPFITATFIVGTLLAAISYWLIEFPLLQLKNINLFHKLSIKNSLNLKKLQS